MFDSSNSPNVKPDSFHDLPPVLAPSIAPVTFGSPIPGRIGSGGES
jgi:hypothetical protein